MKIPRGQGMWPAFWMLGTTRSTGRTPARSTSWRTSASSPPPSTARSTAPATPARAASAPAYSLPNGQAFADAFHTFAVDWAPDSITWSGGRQRLPAAHTRRPGRADLGLQQAVLPDPEPGGRRLLARRPGRLHGLPAAAGGGHGLGDDRRHGHGRGDQGPGAASASTSPGRAPPTAHPYSSTTATAARPSSGPSARTARSARSASAWTSPATARRTGRPSSCGTARVARTSNGPSPGPATSSIRRPTSASTRPGTARPTAPGCSCGPARAAPTRSGRSAEPRPVSARLQVNLSPPTQRTTSGSSRSWTVMPNAAAATRTSVTDLASPTTSPSISTIRNGGVPGCTPSTMIRGREMCGLSISVME